MAYKFTHPNEAKNDHVWEMEDGWRVYPFMIMTKENEFLGLRNCFYVYSGKDFYTFNDKGRCLYVNNYTCNNEEFNLKDVPKTHKKEIYIYQHKDTKEIIIYQTKAIRSIHLILLAKKEIEFTEGEGL